MSTLFTQQPAPKTFRVLPTERERGQAEVNGMPMCNSCGREAREAERG